LHGFQARDVPGDLVLVEDLPYLRQEARQLPGELGVVFSCIREIQELLANQVIEGALHTEAPLDSLRRFALLDPDLLESDAHSRPIYRRPALARKSPFLVLGQVAVLWM